MQVIEVLCFSFPFVPQSVCLSTNKIMPEILQVIFMRPTVTGRGN